MNRTPKNPDPRGPFVEGRLPVWCTLALRDFFETEPDSGAQELVNRLFDLHSLLQFASSWGSALVGGVNHFVINPKPPATFRKLEKARLEIARSLGCVGELVRVKGNDETFLAFSENPMAFSHC